jgi:hypothetical protein
MTPDQELVKKAAQRSVRIAASFLDEDSPDLLASARVAMYFLATAVGRLSELEGRDHEHHLVYLRREIEHRYNQGVHETINPSED